MGVTPAPSKKIQSFGPGRLEEIPQNIFVVEINRVIEELYCAQTHGILTVHHGQAGIAVRQETNDRALVGRNRLPVGCAVHYGHLLLCRALPKEGTASLGKGLLSPKQY
jgi:hypothetical protein